MRPLICSVVALLALAIACDAECRFKDLVLTDILHPPEGCEDDDGEMHGFGTEWAEGCKNCVCHHSGMVCCDAKNTAKDLNPNCEIVVDRKTCTHKTVLKSDNTKQCV